MRRIEEAVGNLHPPDQQFYCGPSHPHPQLHGAGTGVATVTPTQPVLQPGELIEHRSGDPCVRGIDPSGKALKCFKRLTRPDLSPGMRIHTTFSPPLFDVS